LSKAKPKIADKTKAQRSYEKGVELEKRVSKWLKSQYGYKCTMRDLARGKISKRPYEVDVHGIKEELYGVFKTHLWVECKAYRVKRVQITKLVESAKDVKDLNSQGSGLQKWSPAMLMLVSSEGFDIDAIGMANKYRIYCVHASKNFDFVGKKNRENFGNKDESSF
jgi:hypothetical protein